MAIFQGLNNSITKDIDYQFKNIRNLPIDSRYLRYFTNINDIPDKNYDYEGMIIFNEYDKLWYTVEYNGTNLIYVKLRDKLNNEFYRILNYNDEDYDRIQTDIDSLPTKPLFLLILPLNLFYYFDGTKYICLSSINIPVSYKNIEGIKKIPEAFRPHFIIKIKKIPDNIAKYWNYKTNQEENLIYVSPNLFTELDNLNIIDGRIYTDDNYYYLGVVDTTGNRLIKLNSSGNQEFKTTITLNKNGSEVEHNLNSDYLRVFLRYKLFNKSYNQELTNEDFKVLSKNKIFINHIYKDNIQNCEVIIKTL
jgi:hypothetical protein|nr:MAG TPA: hypothetical protein [Caudoviricetes sp.]